VARVEEQCCRGLRYALIAELFSLIICGLALLVSAPTLSSDRVSFPSATFSDISQAAVGTPLEKVEVGGELRFPANAKGHLPAVVTAHTIGGFSETNEGWLAAELRKIGFVTLTYDSFVSRPWP